MFRNKKYFIVSFGAFLAVCLLIGSYNYSDISKFTNAQVSTQKTVIIDAGHGGFDGGAVAEDGTNEKNINLNIALTVGDMLSLSGVNVIYTRTEDTGTEDDSSEDIRNRKRSDLNNRLKIMEQNPDAVFVSVHLNKFTTAKVSGAQVFYSDNFEDSKVIGNLIQTSIKERLQNDNDRVIKKATADTFLLHKAVVPAVIVECGFLSNQRELELLKSEEYQAKMAFAIFCGVNDYLC